MESNNQLRNLFELLVEFDIAEFEHESGGKKVRVVRRGQHVEALGGARLPAPSARIMHQEVRPSVVEAADPNVVDVTCPFVGTFYRSPTPEAPPFAEVGNTVKPGQTLCIVEAMKLMNEIESDVAGVIVEIYAQSGKPVEFGQKLFRIKKS